MVFDAQTLIGRTRRPLAALLLVLALSTAVLVTHSAMSGHDMGDAVVMCLAVADTSAAVVVAMAREAFPTCWLIPRGLMPSDVAEPRRPDAPVPIAALSGPVATQVFLL